MMVVAFVKVAKVQDIPEGQARCYDVAERFIAIVHCEGEFHAIDDTCTHEDASLSEGWVEGCHIECPLHGAHFDVRTGEALTLPAIIPVKTHELKVEGDDILVNVDWDD